MFTKPLGRTDFDRQCARLQIRQNVQSGVVWVPVIGAGTGYFIHRIHRTVHRWPRYLANGRRLRLMRENKQTSSYLSLHCSTTSLVLRTNEQPTCETGGPARALNQRLIISLLVRHYNFKNYISHRDYFNSSLQNYYLRILLYFLPICEKHWGISVLSFINNLTILFWKCEFFSRNSGYQKVVSRDSGFRHIAAASWSAFNITWRKSHSFVKKKDDTNCGFLISIIQNY